jgi:hypothetical protein
MDSQVGSGVGRTRGSLSLDHGPHLAAPDARLGGYLVFGAEELDAAIELASRIPRPG